MKSEWEKVQLGQIADIKGGKRLPKGVNLVNISNKHPYIRVRDLSVTKTLEITPQFEYVDSDTQKTISRYIVSTGDIVLSIVGSIGIAAIIGTTLDGANLTENCVKITNLRNVYREFLFYYLCSNDGQGNIAKGTVGAVQSKLPIKNIQSLEVPLPPLTEQKAIAAVLSALDDKIELNNRINQKLEEMAQAIFKSWFVDFEPFQDGEFVESELGPIPKGWRTGTLGELVTVKYGKDHKKLSDGLIPTFGSGGIMRYVEKPLYSGESVLIPRKGTLNNVIYINEPFWTVDTMFYTEMRMKNIAKFIYFFVSSNDLAAMNSGSAVPSMTVDILNNLKVVIPHQSNFDEFESAVSSLFLQQQCLAKENQQLASLRDTLLPKLMSGELCVPVEAL